MEMFKVAVLSVLVLSGVAFSSTKAYASGDAVEKITYMAGLKKERDETRDRVNKLRSEVGPESSFAGLSSENRRKIMGRLTSLHLSEKHLMRLDNNIEVIDLINTDEQCILLKQNRVYAKKDREARNKIIDAKENALKLRHNQEYDSISKKADDYKAYKTFKFNE